MDHYKVLEISSNASQAEIRVAYKKLAKMYHPDINKSPRAGALFQHISESYHILSNPARRSAYDASLQTSTPYRQYPPYNGSGASRTAHRRNPASFNSRPPLRQADIIKPYMKYAYAVAWLGFAIALLLLVDFAGPAITYQETFSQAYVLPGARNDADYGRSQLIYTEEGTRMEVRAGTETVVLTEGIAGIEKTLLFRFPKKIILQDGVTVKPMILLYAHLSFFPILLFISSGLGTFFRREVVFDFNVCLVSGVLMVITLVMILTTT